MKGLFYKDLVTSRRDLLGLFCTTIFFGAIAFIIPAEIFSFMYMALTFLYLADLPVFLFAYIGQKDWDAFISATPLSKQKIVGSKYALYFLIMPALLLFVVSSYWFLLDGISITLLITIISCAVVLAMIQFPILYQFGAKSGRFISIFIVSFFSGMFMRLYIGGVISLDSITETSFQRLPYYTCAAAVVFTLLSYRLSLAIYRRKER